MLLSASLRLPLFLSPQPPRLSESLCLRNRFKHNFAAQQPAEGGTAAAGGGAQPAADGGFAAQAPLDWPKAPLDWPDFFITMTAN